MTNNLLTDTLSEPLNGATKARFEINSGTGNLRIEPLASDDRMLARGTLQYFEHQGTPTRSVRFDHEWATLTLAGRHGGQRWPRMPWAACNGATEWHVDLNPMVSCEITAHSDGGNVALNLASMDIRQVSADTGGGNLDVVLPDNATNLIVAARSGAGNVTVDIGDSTTGTVTARSGAGNVVVHVPCGLAARVHATSGLGKVSVESTFGKVDRMTYQTPDYEKAVNKLDLTLHTGAGNVSVTQSDRCTFGQADSSSASAVPHESGSGARESPGALPSPADGSAVACTSSRSAPGRRPATLATE